MLPLDEGQPSEWKILLRLAAIAGGQGAHADLAAFDDQDWTTSPEPLERIADRTDTLRRYALLTPAMEARLTPVDRHLYRAGLHGADEAGLFRPGQAKP